MANNSINQIQNHSMTLFHSVNLQKVVKTEK